MSSRSASAPVDPSMVQFATIRHWGQISGMARSTTYHALASGQLRAKKVGKTTLIDVRHGLSWLRAQPDAKIRLPNSRRQIGARGGA
jgi:hypothetical protein